LLGRLFVSGLSSGLRAGGLLLSGLSSGLRVGGLLLSGMLLGELIIFAGGISLVRRGKGELICCFGGLG
jgi:hypothetical protein